MLRPVAKQLVPPLSEFSLDSKRDVEERARAAGLLADYAKDDRRLLTKLLGSWGGTAWYCRSAGRNGESPGNRNSNLGFRVAAVQLSNK